jgi:hypothetical protein
MEGAERWEAMTNYDFVERRRRRKKKKSFFLGVWLRQESSHVFINVLYHSLVCIFLIH